MIKAQAPATPGPVTSGCEIMRYFFHVTSDDGNVTDLVGVDLPDVAAPRYHAAAQVTELWEARVLAGKPPLVGWVEVTDDNQRGVLRMPL